MCSNEQRNNGLNMVNMLRGIASNFQVMTLFVGRNFFTRCMMFVPGAQEIR